MEGCQHFGGPAPPCACRAVVLSFEESKKSQREQFVQKRLSSRQSPPASLFASLVEAGQVRRGAC